MTTFQEEVGTGTNKVRHAMLGNGTPRDLDAEAAQLLEDLLGGATPDTTLQLPEDDEPLLKAMLDVLEYEGDRMAPMFEEHGGKELIAHAGNAIAAVLDDVHGNDKAWPQARRIAESVEADVGQVVAIAECRRQLANTQCTLEMDVVE